MKNYLSLSNGGKLHDDIDGPYRFARPLTSSSENNVGHVRRSNAELFSNGHQIPVNFYPTNHPKSSNKVEPSAYQISGSTDRLSVNSFTTTTTVPAGHNLR